MLYGTYFYNATVLTTSHTLAQRPSVQLCSRIISSGSLITCSRHLMRPLLASSIITITLTLANTASAQAHETGFSDDWQPREPIHSQSTSFTGSFTDVSARFGFANLSDASAKNTSVDAGVRAAFPMYLLDTRLAYRFDSFSIDDGMRQHSLGLSTGLHPLYLLMLKNDWLGYFAASFYIDLGAGVKSSTLTTAGESTRDRGVYWHWGLGIDVPLTNPDAGKSLWLNFLYRNMREDFDRADDTSLDLNRHMAIVGLSWRMNGLPF